MTGAVSDCFLTRGGLTLDGVLCKTELAMCRRDAKRALGRVRDDRIENRETPHGVYQIFYTRVHRIKVMIDKHPQSQSPVETYNHLVDCLQTFGVYDDHHFMHYLEKKPMPLN